MADNPALAEQFEKAANLLNEFGYTDTPSGRPMFPQVVNFLRAHAKTLRSKGKPKQGRKRSVKAHVGRSGKGGDFHLATDRLDE